MKSQFKNDLYSTPKDFSVEKFISKRLKEREELTYKSTKVRYKNGKTAIRTENKLDDGGILTIINDVSDFSISANSQSGINFYTLVEIDEGDNDENKVVTYIHHNFTFSSFGGGSINWDFDDGDMATGQGISHQ